MRNKIIAYVLVLSMCLSMYGAVFAENMIAFDSSNVTALKVKFENVIKEKKQYEFTSDEEHILKKALNVGNGREKAELVNSMENDEAFSKAVKEILNHYYDSKGNVLGDLDVFTSNVHNRADIIINNYKEAAEERKNSQNLDYITDEIVVSFDASISDDRIQKLVKEISEDGELIHNRFSINEELSEEKKELLRKTSENIQSKTVVVKIGKAYTTQRAIEEYQRISGIKHVSRNILFELFDVNINDEYADYSWHLNKVNVSDGWESVQTATSASDVWVAVIDTGIDMQQPDLKDNIIKSLSADITGSQPVLLKDMNTTYVSEHGTNVAGVISAKVNNEIGVAGIAGISTTQNDYRCKIMAIQAATLQDGQYKLASINMAKAIYYAVSKGAEVINISSGAPAKSAEVEEAVNFAYSNGVTIVAAAGNDSANAKVYPSALAHVISVIASDPDDERAWFSNYGSHNDISAPGFSVYTTRVNGEYDAKNGTSFSAPIVAATAAMMKSLNPLLSPDDIESAIKITATDIGTAGFDIYTAQGLINTGLAVQRAKFLTISGKTPVIKGIASNSEGTISFYFNTLGQEERYNIYRSNNYNGTYEQIKAGKVTEEGKILFTDKSLQSGKTYYYKVWCKTKYGNTYKHSNYSSIVSCTAS